jgi:DNA (cytosine-5)-methyltransferase 1
LITSVDLFCGAGGMSLGLSNAGIAVIGALDSWAPAVRTYQANFKHPIVDKDIRKCDPQEFLQVVGADRGDLDLVTGGPPCQGFSIQRIGADKDERNDLIFEFGRFVLALRPRVFLMENVKGLLGSRGRYFAARLKEMLSRGGYAVETKVVNAAEYGVPQVRKRVFVYGWRNDQPASFFFPEPELSPDRFVTVTDAIGNLPSPPADYLPMPGDSLHRRMRISELNLERLSRIPPGGGFEDLPVELRVNAHKNGADKIGHRYVYGRLDPDKPAGTITARFDSFTRGRFAHPREDRNITLREGARLQTFPDDFKFEGTQEEIAALIGNAVPPLLAKKIGSAVAGYLKGEYRPESLLGPLFSKSA